MEKYCIPQFRINLLRSSVRAFLLPVMADASCQWAVKKLAVLSYWLWWYTGLSCHNSNGIINHIVLFICWYNKYACSIIYYKYKVCQTRCWKPSISMMTSALFSKNHCIQRASTCECNIFHVYMLIKYNKTAVRNIWQKHVVGLLGF